MTEATLLSDRIPEVRRENSSHQDLKNIITNQDDVEDSPESRAAGADFSQRTLSSVSSSSSLSCRSDSPTNTNTSSITKTGTESSRTTASTSPSSPSIQRAAVKKKLQEEHDRTFRKLLLTLVLQQLEYYLHPLNLATDTYLRTFTTLNDGCIPCLVLADLANIKALVWATPALQKRYATDEARLEVVREAVQEQPSEEESSGDSRLRVLAIDTATSLVVPSFAEGKTIWAIRPATTLKGGGRDEEDTRSVVSASTTSTTGMIVSNTVLLRDVQQSVTEEQIRALFEKELGSDCPSILSIEPDVANCWLVALDTTDRDTMLRIIMELRGCTLGGDHVHARLKSSTLHQAPVCPVSEAVAKIVAAAAAAPRKHKTRTRSKKKRQKEASSVCTGWSSKQQQAALKDTKKKAQQQPPPSFKQDDFPTLLEDTVVWSTPPALQHETEQDEKGDDREDDADESSNSKAAKSFSDGASTATTTSSSIESFPKKSYAAVALKSAAVEEPATESMPPRPERAAAKVATDATGAPSEAVSRPTNDKQSDATKTTADSDTTTMVINPPKWGKGRTFADVAS